MPEACTVQLSRKLSAIDKIRQLEKERWKFACRKDHNSFRNYPAIADKTSPRWRNLSARRQPKQARKVRADSVLIARPALSGSNPTHVKTSLAHRMVCHP